MSPFFISNYDSGYSDGFRMVIVRRRAEMKPWMSAGLKYMGKTLLRYARLNVISTPAEGYSSDPRVFSTTGNVAYLCPACSKVDSSIAVISLMG